MTSSGTSSRTPLIASIIVIIILAGAFAYVYETSSATLMSQSRSIASLNGQISNQAGSISSLNGLATYYQTEVSALSSNITDQIVAEGALQAKLIAEVKAVVLQTAAIKSLSSQVSSYSEQISSQISEISAQQSTLDLQVPQTLVNNVTLNMPFNSSVTITHFTASGGGYLQISGTSDTNILIAVCYGATSQAECDSSHTYYAIDFGHGGSVFNAPLMPGPVWINAYDYLNGTATLTVVLYA